MKKTTTPPETPNPEALMDLVYKMVGDLGAVASGSLVLLGDRLGIYRALAASGPATVEELATETGLNARYLREWLSNQTASGYISYEENGDCFSMTPEQSAVLADPNSPVLMTGGFYAAASTYHDEPKIAEAFRTGAGVGWGEHHDCLFCGTEKFFRPGYAANLVESWIPALQGVSEKLQAGGARVADVGCGHGASTIILAAAFPDTEFVGYDPHLPSIAHAREHAKDVPNVSFELGSAQDFPQGEGFDLVTIFDALHDMGDPAGACAHIRGTLRPEGTLMIVEPMAGDKLSENLNPISRVYYAFSTMVCTPNSLSQEVGAALGAQAGEAKLRAVAEEGGFTQFRRATETPFNLILEAKA